jgi:hypothetical protein
VINGSDFARTAINHGFLVEELIEVLRVNGLEPPSSDPTNMKLKQHFEQREKQQYEVK